MSNFLLELAKIIESRKNDDEKKSYTSFLLSKGFIECLKKFKEESEEFTEAIKNNNNIVHESADVIYHFLVTLESRGIKFIDVIKELEKRKDKSGHEEKNNRSI
jgi:phosphoribosyl-ATP pyrophosphohydrolase|tara:strand:+ start:2072 stop:2383 length:312 start_codon:yes stop_codon:yes gene_type:complete